MKKWVFFIFVFSFLSFIHQENVFARSDYYYIEKDGYFYNEDGAKYKSMKKDILKSKSISVSEEMKRLSVDYFNNSYIGLDMKIKGTNDSLWSKDLDSLKNNVYPFYVTIYIGNINYDIYVPSKNDTNASLEETIDFLKEYKKTVEDSIAFGSIYGTVNIYTIIPDKQYALKDILKEAESDGKKLGYKEFNMSKIKSSYKLDYLYNPILGKVEKKDFKDEMDFIKQVKKKLKLKVVNGNLDFDVNFDYDNFIAELKDSDSPFIKIKNVNGKLDGVGDVKYDISGKTYSPVNVTDASFYIAVPYLFVKKDSGGYGVATNGGYKIIKDYKLLPSTSYVLKKDVKGVKKIGDFASFGISMDSLYLYYAKVDNKTVGVIIPLWYKEIVKNTLPIGDGIYYTGRTLKFGNDYSGKLKLNDKKKDIFSVDTKTTSKKGIEIRNYAFLPKAKLENAVDHKAVSSKEEEFKVEIDFLSTDVVRGFVMYRNNAYIDDKEFLEWLDSSTAKSLTDVNAEELLKLIKGELGVEKKDLTYEDWKRIDEIKKELEFDRRGIFFNIANTLLIVVGVLIGLYANILLLVYFADIHLNLEKPIFTILTFGRFYPISNRDVDLVSVSSGYKYISLKGVIILWVIYMSIMLVFILNEWLFSLIIWLYYTLTM